MTSAAYDFYARVRPFSERVSEANEWRKWPHECIKVVWQASHVIICLLHTQKKQSRIFNFHETSHSSCKQIYSNNKLRFRCSVFEFEFFNYWNRLLNDYSEHTIYMFTRVNIPFICSPAYSDKNPLSM